MDVAEPRGLEQTWAPGPAPVSLPREWPGNETGATAHAALVRGWFEPVLLDQSRADVGPTLAAQTCQRAPGLPASRPLRLPAPVPVPARNAPTEPLTGKAGRSAGSQTAGADVVPACNAEGFFVLSRQCLGGAPHAGRPACFRSPQIPPPWLPG